MPLQSEFRNNAQLVDCAQRDPAHVGRQFNSRGPHVKLIRKALNAWLGRETVSPKPPRLDETSEVYDDKVASMVRLFKTRKRILNHKGEIDDIVGIKTVDALDKELPIEIDPIVLETGFTDVVVKFQGALTPTPLPIADNDVIPASALAAYMTAKIASGKRRLLRVGHQTTGFGNTTKAIRSAIIGKVKTELETPGRALGQVFVFGSSSGGRNAIEFTAEFAAAVGRVRYLAVADAACFPQDTSTVPDRVPDPTNVPLFDRIGAAGVPAEVKKNFFQTAGNRSDTRFLSSQRIFVSDMDNKEVHGQIPGFPPVDLTALVRTTARGSTPKELADSLHIQCSRQALPSIHRDIGAVLNSLP